MGAVPWDTLPDEIWTFILSKSSIQTLIQTQNVNRRFESLVQSLPIFQDFLHEEDSIIKALVTNWLGSPFDIVRPLTDPDWELLRPVLRARFRFLVKKSHGGFEDILLRAEKNDQSHYMVNKGWLYKAFLRNLHDNQRQKLIEPLRHRFEEKLKTQAYVCKKCGNGYRPVNKDSCYAHVGQPMMTHIENVWTLSCCPHVSYFARGNGANPLPNVRRHLGFCHSNYKSEHQNDDFKNLKTTTTVDISLVPCGEYKYHEAVILAARDEGFELELQSGPPTYCSNYQNGSKFYPITTHNAHQNAEFNGIYTLNSLTISNNTQNLRYPNPKTNHRFGPSDWYDFFENDFDYEDDESRKKKKKSKKKKIPPSTYKSESGTSGSQTEAVAVRSKHQKEEFEEAKFQNPPGEFEIGIWRPDGF